MRSFPGGKCFPSAARVFNFPIANANLCTGVIQSDLLPPFDLQGSIMTQQETPTGMSTYLHVSDNLKELFPELPRALKVAATYMLEHPGDIATLSMRQVAGNAGVSLPNFSRLAKLLGFETYGELREIYRKQVQ